MYDKEKIDYYMQYINSNKKQPIKLMNLSTQIESFGVYL